MNLRQLARRSLRFYFRAHLGVLAGATLAAAVLIGALVVGDSVKESLKAKAAERIGGLAFAIHSNDRFFRQELLSDDRAVASVLLLPATLSRQDASARANHVQLLGVRRDFAALMSTPAPGQTPEQRARQALLTPPLSNGGPAQTREQLAIHSHAEDLPPPGTIILNAALAGALHAHRDDELVLRIHKPSALSRDAVITPRDGQSVALRVKVWQVLDEGGGNFSLEANQTTPFNAFMDMDALALTANLPHRANLLLRAGDVRDASTRMVAWLDHHGKHVPDFIATQLIQWSDARSFNKLATPTDYEPIEPQLTDLNRKLLKSWTLPDAELELHAVEPAPKLTGGEPAPAFAELTTRRIFLEPAVVAAALTNQADSPAVPVLTYLVNSLAHGDDLAPYSMVAAAGAPYTPADLKDDEIVVNEWLATDLGVKAGDTLDVAYYRVDASTQLVEHTNTFRVRSVVPLRGLYADRTLMPEFPGLTKAESTRDWDAGFDLVHPIRDQDEAYWKQWRGTPKAFITLAAGQKMWANRFGDLTAIRWFGTNTAALSIV
ncbi:MAG TPA: hypothetical protein VMB21_01500, partial [Candidatus Limnocylindria bacterium]|nr:hypothetical protein [Candidatus Limnocylindria bacterium]